MSGVAVTYSPREADRAGWWWRISGGAAFVWASVFAYLGWLGLVAAALLVWGMCQRQTGYQFGWRDGYRTHLTMPRRRPRGERA